LKASVEIIAAVVRVGENTDGYGSPFEFACVAAGNGGHVTIKALVNPDRARFKFGSAHRRAIARELGRLGFTSFDFERLDSDGDTKREIAGLISDGATKGVTFEH
jgi:hypothetical protein